METKELLELGFKKRNCWKGSDDYYLERDGIGFCYIVEKDSDNYQESFIQNNDSYRHMKSKEDFSKCLKSDNPWTLAIKIGER